MGDTYEDIRRFQAGEDAACERLFERYFERVLSFVRIRMSSELRAVIEPEDLVQRTLLVAFQRLDDFEMRARGAFMHWLAKLAENQIRDEVKRCGNEKHDVRREQPILQPRSAGASSWAELALAGSTTHPPEQAAKQELIEIVEAQIRALPQDYQTVIGLRLILEATLEYTAQEMGRSPQAVAMLYARAMLKLMQLCRHHRDEE